MRRATTLYHYTSQAALIEIIRSDSLWLTDVRYLNDSTEYVYSLNLVRELLRQRFSYDDRALILFQGHVQNEIARQSQPLMLTSMSEVGDLLSQWRAYSVPGKGVALGFDQKLLRELVHRFGGWLRRAEYSESRQKKLLTKHLGQATDDVRAAIPSRPSTSRAAAKWDARIFSPEGQPPILGPAGRFVEQVLPLASVFKHPSFREEREWRLVVPMRHDLPINFRSGASYLVPYTTMALDLEHSRVLTEIVVGPSPQPQLAKESIERMMTESLSYSVTVRTSEIPFRAW